MKESQRKRSNPLSVTFLFVSYKENIIMENEIWKSVKGYEGQYEISNLGQVRSVDRVVKSGNGAKRFIKGKVLKPFWGNKNQLCIFLSKNSIYKLNLVYRLMAIAFLPNPLNKPTVNHKDGRRRNNSLSNLEWATWSENNKHAFDTGLNNPTANLPKNHKKVAMLSTDGNVLHQFLSMTEAASFVKGTPQHISMVCNNRPNYKTAYGYKWKLI